MGQQFYGCIIENGMGVRYTVRLLIDLGTSQTVNCQLRVWREPGGNGCSATLRRGHPVLVRIRADSTEIC